jgi:two-component system sensor histidine kinase BarA
MHYSNYFDDVSMSSGILHLSNAISPHDLFEQIHTHTAEISQNPTAPRGKTRPDPVGHMRGLKDLRVLVADDNDINQHLLQVYVSRNGGEYLVAHDGQEAIDLCREYPVDVVIMDLHMPNLDGIQAMKSLKAKAPYLLIIAVTADASPDSQDRYIGYGFDSCLIKPVTEKKLLRCVSELLDTFLPYKSRHAATRRHYGNDKMSPVIDIEKAINIVGGNRQLAQEIYDLLLEDLASKRPLLVNNQVTELEQLMELAHKIRGGAKYCAAERLELRAKRLQEAIETHQDAGLIQALTKGLAESIEVLLGMENPYTGDRSK